VSDDLFDLVRWLITAVARGLKARGGEGTPEVLRRLAEQQLERAVFGEPGPRRVKVCRRFAECAAMSLMVDTDLAAALASIEEHLHWRHSSGYSDRVLGEGFMDEYGWCEIIGSSGFFPGDDFRLGLLMLGPERHYKDHYHPAPELYWPLTGPSDWKQGSGAFAAKQAGDVIWHPASVIHATWTHETPLLAVWCWTRDVNTPAKLVEV
jgi:Dimethlysulfonioproprionate lyase